MKEEILSLLNMKDILNKYGIKIKKYMCNCPFHKDNSPSMKIYDKSFYCFSCNRTGDFIEFVKKPSILKYLKFSQFSNELIIEVIDIFLSEIISTLNKF